MKNEEKFEAIKEFIRRSQDGPIMREIDFDIKMSRQLRVLTSEYSIRFTPEETICDDVLADSIWHAALQLLERVGIYNIDTNRVVFLERKELEAAAARVPKYFSVGEGKDALTVKARAHDSTAAPIIVASPSENLRNKGGFQTFFIKSLHAYCSDSGPLGEFARELDNELDGLPYLADTPGEMIWARAAIRWQKTIAELLGKPGLWLGAIGVSSIPAALACYMEDGLLNRFNSNISVPLMPELKLNWDCLQLTCAAKAMGVYRHCQSFPIIGAYCRNGEEAAVIAVASLLGQMAYAGDEIMVALGVGDRQADNTARGPLQATSGGHRAIERHLGIPMSARLRTKNNLGTSLSLYELAASTINRTGSGMAWAGGFACGLGAEGEYKVDLDFLFVSKISQGIADMDRERANELLQKLLHLYENRDAAATGKPYDYYYDMKTLTPAMNLVALYDTVEDELRKLGVPIQEPFTGS